MTLVAVCFDGSKFTCGFEKCGMTFSRARDVQRHLKCAHPEHLRLENKEHKHDNEREPKSKGEIREKEPDVENKGQNEPSTHVQPVKSCKERQTLPHGSETNASSLQAKSDALKEILLMLSKLDLNSFTGVLASEVSQSSLEPSASQVSLHQTAPTSSPASLPEESSQQPEDDIIQPEETLAADDEASLQKLANAKPYVCEIGGCEFRTAQNYSLMRHYSTKHGRTVEQAKKLTSLKATSFKPYACHLCSKSHRQKHALRAHYIHMHNMSQTLVEKIRCASVEHKSLPLANHHMKMKNTVQEKKNSKDADDPQDLNDNHLPSEEEGEEHPENREEGEKKEEDGAPQQVRTRRVVTRNNLCYILDKFSKPFHCVAKNCDAAFSSQGGLVRHLQMVHHYNRSQLLLDKDEDEQHSPEVRKEPAKKRPLPTTDEPQPQFKCHFANCKASYHLRSSLVRHTRECHSQPPEAIQCESEGCTKVFNHQEALKKHMLYSHCDYYDSLVVRLQSSHNNQTVAGCQSNDIVAPQSPQNEEPNSNETKAESLSPEPEVPPQTEEPNKDDVERKVPTEKVSKRRCYNQFVFRSYEEALQMCQDRCLRVAYPCMIQDCESVVTYMGSLHRHYLKVHCMRRDDLMKNEDKLVFNAEQLEELIQRNSARLTGTGMSVSNEGFKMEPPADPENTDAEQPAPMSAHLAKSETKEEEKPDPLTCEVKEPPPVERNGVLLVADEVLYGEPSADGHSEEEPVAETPICPKPEGLAWEKIKLRPVTVDLSPPYSLRFTTEEGFQDVLPSKDGGKMLNVSVLLPHPPVRQPLKRKNELPDQPPNLKDTQPCSPSSNSFDIAAYKPVGFESSFLRYIQDATAKDRNQGPVRRESFRRSCSVKENNRLGVALTRSKRNSSPLVKRHAVTGDLTSVQNLKSILDKALAGCGDLAIKQLQYLRPVVVLERPVCSNTTATDLLPSDINNSKLLLGS